MSYAVIYCGFLGDIKRYLKNLDDIIPNNYTLFIVTEDFNINKVRTLNRKNVDIKCYSKEELSKLKNYGDSLEWKKNKKYVSDYLEK